MNEEYDYLNFNNEEQIKKQRETETKNKKEQKKLDKATAAADAAIKTIVVIKGGKDAGKVYDTAKQTNIGKKVVQTAGKVLNYSSKTSRDMRISINTASKLNKIVNHGNEVKAEKINAENNTSNNSNNNISSNKSSNSSLNGNSKKDLLGKMFQGKSSSNSSFNFFGKGNKKFSMLKLKIYHLMS